MTWPALSLLLAILSAVTSLVGGIRAKSLTPDSAPNVRQLVATLEPFLRTQAALLKELSSQANRSQVIPGTVPVAIFDAMQVAEQRATQAHRSIDHALDTSAAAATAGSARAWMCAGAFLAMLSAVIQIALLMP